MMQSKNLLISRLLVGLAMLCCLVAVFAAPVEELDADPHLQGWWKFDESSGKVARDSSSHHRDAVLEGGLSFDTDSKEGAVGKSLAWDGRDDAVRVTGWKGITGTSPRTVAAWILTGAPKGEIVSWGLRDFGKMWILSFIRRHVGVTPHGGYYYMEATIHDKKWHHVAATVRKAKLPNLYEDVTLYRDGKLATIDRIGLLDLWPIETGAEQDVTIGRGFNGQLDDVRIYDRALTDEDVQSLYRQRK